MRQWRPIYLYVCMFTYDYVLGNCVGYVDDTTSSGRGVITNQAPARSDNWGKTRATSATGWCSQRGSGARTVAASAARRRPCSRPSIWNNTLRWCPSPAWPASTPSSGSTLALPHRRRPQRRSTPPLQGRTARSWARFFVGAHRCTTDMRSPGRRGKREGRSLGQSSAPFRYP